MLSPMSGVVSLAVSDVVAVGLITGGASLATAVVGSVVTIAVSRRQGKTELEKLGLEHREEHRRGRQDAYRKLLTRANRVDTIAIGSVSSDDDDLGAELDGLAVDIVSVYLVAGEKVRGPLKAFDKEFTDIQQKAAEKGEGKVTVQTFRAEYIPQRQTILSTYGGLVDVMRDDVAAAK